MKIIRKTMLLLVSIVFLGVPILTNVGVGYAEEQPEIENVDESKTYYQIHYNGEEQKIVINERTTLNLKGWIDETKTFVSGKMDIIEDSETLSKEVTLNVSDDINELAVTETESIFYQITVSDSFKTDLVDLTTLNQENDGAAENSNDSSTDEETSVDNSGSETTYDATDENNQTVTEEPLIEESNVANKQEDSVVSNEEQIGKSSNRMMLAAIQPKSTSSLKYRTHVETHGWQEFVPEGAMSGTSGEAKRLEAIEITGVPGISYRTHVQDYGWQEFVSEGKLSGTSGKAKRLEAIEIKLTGESANQYDIYYRVHAQDYGWLGWAKNGETSGTAGLAKRLEAIEIKLVTKGGQAPGTTKNSFVIDPGVSYSTHVQNYGWMNFVENGALSGTSGEAKRLEGIKIKLKNKPYPGNIVYTTHVQDYGWLPKVSNGAMSGTSGEAKRLEAITIDLTGEIAKHFDVYYRVHIQDHGWLGWAKNGMYSGSEKQAKRLEAIEIKLVPIGQGEPVNESDAFKTTKYTVNNYYDLSLNDATGIQMKVSPQTDKVAAGYIQADEVDVFGSIAGYSVNLRTLPNLSNNTVSILVGQGTEFTVLDNNVTGDSFQNSTRWFKIYYKGQILYVHSKLATINYAVVTKNGAKIQEQAKTNSFILDTVNTGAQLAILDAGASWHKVNTQGWRNAIASEVSYYLNPANFVNDKKQSLQFLDLSKQIDVSANLLNRFLDGKGVLDGKGQVFLEASRENGINVMYLISHSLLETGHGTSSLATGITYNGTTVHNMYGIQAFDWNPNGAGAKYAYEQDWTTVDKAIKGGAKWIKNRYIDAGQNTLYEMRWNPLSMDRNGYASMQYASDIGWAYKQINSLYNIMDEVYKVRAYSTHFEIPKYK